MIFQQPYRILRTLLLVSLAVGCGRAADNAVSTQAGDEPADDSKARVNEFVDGIKKSMLQCPERIWPGYDWRNVSVYLTDRSRELAYQWQPGVSDDVSTVPLASVPSQLSSSFYGFIRDPEHPAIGLSLDLSAEVAKNYKNTFGSEYLINLGVHEAFHAFEQSTWTTQFNGERSRATIYPLAAEPRYLRYLLLKTMKSYLDAPTDELLNEVAAIQAKYQSEHTAEAQSIASTDKSEGSAEYVSQFAEAIAKHGCDADEAILIKDVRDSLERRKGFSTSADSESYPLGVASALILRSLEEKKGWEAKVEASQAPVDILVEGREIGGVPEDIEVRDAINSLVESQNQALALPIDAYIASKADAGNVGVVLPFDRMLGSFQTSGFVDVPSSNLSLIMNFSGRFAAKDQLISTIQVQTTAEESSGTTCGSGLLFYVPSNSLGDLQASTLSIESTVLKASGVKFSLGKDGNDRDVVCL